MEQEDYQIIIVGAGPAGVSVAYPLVTAGYKVAMLDAGDRCETPLVYERNDLYSLRIAGSLNELLGSDLRGVRKFKDLSPKLKMVRNTKFLEKWKRKNALIEKNFSSVGIFENGGLSNYWGAVVGCYSEEDFLSDVIPMHELKKSYQILSARIGISGTNDDEMSDTWGLLDNLLPPVKISKNADVLLSRYNIRNGNSSLRLGQNRSAVLTQSQNQRLGCNLCNACMIGCNRNSIYSAKFDLLDLKKFNNFHFFDSMSVTELISGAKPSIKARDLKNQKIMILSADRVLLAAGVIASTKLVLSALKSYDEEIVFKNTPAFSFATLIPSRIGQAVSKSGFGMGQLSFKIQLSEKKEDYALGLLFDAHTVAKTELASQMPFTPSGSKKIIGYLTPGLMFGLVYLPSEYSQNTMKLSSVSNNLHLNGIVSSDLNPTVHRLTKVIRKEFGKLGAWLLPGSTKTLALGSEIHYGSSLAAGVFTDEFGELYRLPKFHVVDGAMLPRLSAKHHTFTVMANADRIGRHFANSLR